MNYFTVLLIFRNRDNRPGLHILIGTIVGSELLSRSRLNGRCRFLKVPTESLTTLVKNAEAKTAAAETKPIMTAAVYEFNLYNVFCKDNRIIVN